LALVVEMTLPREWVVVKASLAWVLLVEMISPVEVAIPREVHTSQPGVETISRPDLPMV
jgi:hypothetical protein